MDFYVKGFLQMIVDKIFTMAPELHRDVVSKFN
jgi:hypothetical protein